ncbi:NAD-glutamate dehydrogenase [Pseudomonas aeruginosa]|nr:NAD-glutamate dehydrogenase [Pseudomonas aeruginosa]
MQFILRVDPKSRIDIDLARLEEEVIQACRSWQDDYSSLVVENPRRGQGHQRPGRLRKAFPAGYRERFARTSRGRPAAPAQPLRAAPAGDELLPPLAQGEQQLHCKLYHADTLLALSDVLPILENLGLRVLGEFPTACATRTAVNTGIHDFAFTYAEGLDWTSSSSTRSSRTPSSTSSAATPRTTPSTAWC